MTAKQVRALKPGDVVYYRDPYTTGDMEYRIDTIRVIGDDETVNPGVEISTDDGEMGCYAIQLFDQPLSLPTVHMNGTGAKDLLEEAEAAYDAVGAALTALRRMTVNGRDYYVQIDPRAFYKASDQHRDRQFALQQVQNDLERLMGHLEEAVRSRT